MTVFFDIISQALQTYKAIIFLVPFLFNIYITILGMFMYAILLHFYEIGIIIPNVSFSLAVSYQTWRMWVYDHSIHGHVSWQVGSCKSFLASISGS